MKPSGLILEKSIVKKKQVFIKKDDFKFFLNWNSKDKETIDVSSMSFIAIEDLFNTNKLLVELLQLKKIKQLLKRSSENEIDPSKIEKLLRKITSESYMVKKTRSYILLKLSFEQGRFKDFIDGYEKLSDRNLKESLILEYIESLFKLNINNRAIAVFKEKKIPSFNKISKLEEIITKKYLKILFSEFNMEDWIDTFIHLVNENKHGSIKKLSNYIREKNLYNLFLAEYNYNKKKYSVTKRLLNRVKHKRLEGFKKRILYKIRLRKDKYDLLLTQADELSDYPDAEKDFLLNAAKLSVKERPDLSKLLFKKYIDICKTEAGQKKRNKTDNYEYWGAMWRLIWLYKRNFERNEALTLIKEVETSSILSYKIAAKYWSAKNRKGYSRFIENQPFSYYFILQNRNSGKKAITNSEGSFNSLFSVQSSKFLYKIIKNVKTVLQYGMVIDVVNYIESEIEKNHYLNKTDRNYLRIISLILSVREGKYSQASWKYSRLFENYRSIQLPRYLSEIMFPLKYFEIVKQYSKIKGIDPFLIMALIKQESSFKPNATSPSKAYGLMQLLLKTANRMAKKYKKRVYRVNLFIPEINIKYGIEYLNTLLEKYNGNIYYTLAAYNAGDHRVDAWLPQMGVVTDEEFVEMIPFTETRNYVKLIIRNYYYYKYYYLN